METVLEMASEDMVYELPCKCRIKTGQHFQFCPIHALLIEKLLKEKEENFQKNHIKDEKT